MSKRGKVRLLAVLAVFCLVLAAVGWGVGLCGAAEEKSDLGRYQAVAPDLVLDTATGKLTDSRGGALEAPIDPAGKDFGRYSAAGYMTVITRLVGLNVVSQPYVQQALIKGYNIVDTKTGVTVRQRVYSSQPIAMNELQPS